MNDAATKILAECLERMEAGASLESCLASFPKQAAELEPLLRMAQQMKNLAEIGPRPAFSQNARLRLENQLAASNKAVTFERPIRHITQRPNFLFRVNSGLMRFILAVALALTATTAGVAYAAQDSNPGDLLHGVDLAIEQARVTLTPGVSGKIKLRIAFAQERLKEAQATFSKNDTTNGLAALNEYKTEISAITQLIENANDANKEDLISIYEADLSARKGTLTKLLATVPAQAQEAIQTALDESNAPAAIATGSSNDTDYPAGPPTSVPESSATDHPIGKPTDHPAGGPPTSVPGSSATAHPIGKPTAHPAGGPPTSAPGGSPPNPAGKPSGKPSGKPNGK